MGFIQDLTGASARKDLKRSKAASDRELQAGYDQAQPFYEQAYSAFTPYAQSGQIANDTYNQAIGLGTPEQRTAAQDRYFTDPAAMAVLNQQSNALLRQQNARGGTYGGQAILAGGRLGLEGYNNWLNRLQGQGSQGFQASSNQAQIREGQGNLRFGLGQTKAGQEINFGNALGASRSIGINNLLSIAGTAAKAYGSFSGIPVK